MSELFSSFAQHLPAHLVNSILERFHLYSLDSPMADSTKILIQARFNQILCRRIAHEWAAMKSDLASRSKPGWEALLSDDQYRVNFNDKAEADALIEYLKLMPRVWVQANARDRLNGYFLHYREVYEHLYELYQHLPTKETVDTSESSERHVIQEQQVTSAHGTSVRQWDFVPANEVYGNARVILNPDYIKALEDLKATEQRLLNAYRLGLTDEQAEQIANDCLTPVKPFGAALWPRSEFMSAAAAQIGAKINFLDKYFLSEKTELREWASQWKKEPIEDLPAYSLLWLDSWLDLWLLWRIRREGNEQVFLQWIQKQIIAEPEMISIEALKKLKASI